MTPLPDPSPLVQTAVYMVGIAAGYTLLTTPQEWQHAWETVRTLWERNRS
jgi:hypothetical protein